MIRLADQKPQLQYKLKDLRVLEEGFREYMQDRFITAEELLTRFCQAAPRSGMLKDCSMVFDGFTGFTPVQLSALETLLKLTPQIRISVTLGAGEPVTGQCGEHELFYLSRKTIGSLLRLARKTGTQVLDPVVLDGKGGRFRENDSLAFLEKELFRYGKRETWKGEKPAHFHLGGQKSHGGGAPGCQPDQQDDQRAGDPVQRNRRDCRGSERL